ncbi:unnamed protein product, partial [Chrysoparadoxa australica]
WLFGELRGESGWVPINYVELQGTPTSAPAVSSGQAAPAPPAGAAAAAEAAPQPSLAPPPARAKDQVRALFDYTAAGDDELGFPKGSVIEVLGRSGGWWTGRLGVATGLFPSNYVESIAATAADAMPP